MDSQLMEFQGKLDVCLQQVQQLMVELMIIRKKSPKVQMESAKLLEEYLIQFLKMTKEVSEEHEDDLMQGISLLKVKLRS